MSENNKEEMTLEEAFKQLNELVTKMDSKGLPLEESFRLYQQGVSLIAFCNASIDKVEKKIIQIRAEAENGNV